MKKYTVRFSTILFLISHITLGGYAQDQKLSKWGSFDFFIGLNGYGPAKQMNNLMIDNKFNATISNIFDKNKTTSYPKINGSTRTIQFSFSKRLKTKTSLGILFSSSEMKSITGLSTQTGVLNYLSVRLSDYSIFPYFSYEFIEKINIQSGIGLMMNRCGKTAGGNLVGEENYQKTSAGFLVGLNMKLWDRSVSYGKIAFQYILTSSTNMGSFTAENIKGKEVVEANKINYSRLNFGLVFGFKL
jgi:hypothetical protein